MLRIQDIDQDYQRIDAERGDIQHLGIDTTRGD